MAYYRRFDGNAGSGFSDEDFVHFVRDVADKIRAGEDAAEIIRFKKLFKKNVPLGMRSSAAALITKLMLERNNGRFSHSPGQFSNGRESRRPFYSTIDSADSVIVYIGIGKNRQVFTRDILTLLIQIGGVARDRIGDIRGLDSYSFVQLYAEDAEQVIRRLNGYNFRGKILSVSLSRKATDEMDAPPQRAALLDEEEPLPDPDVVKPEFPTYG
ncbi:MAG: DbpA RNA binding domain-containing protein [Treponema sp.]|nr:DbpA RNA binding domain-containing protein [Treponema sp.]